LEEPRAKAQFLFLDFLVPFTTTAAKKTFKYTVNTHETIFDLAKYP
jgi:hypothetical protein